MKMEFQGHLSLACCFASQTCSPHKQACASPVQQTDPHLLPWSSVANALGFVSRKDWGNLRVMGFITIASRHISKQGFSALKDAFEYFLLEIYSFL